MSNKDTQVVQFANALDDLIGKFATDEWDLNRAEIIGILQLKSHQLCEEIEDPYNDIH